MFFHSLPLNWAFNLLFIFAALAGLGFLIGFHELGHFLFCKLFNVRTPSFSIGFGPRLLTKKIGDTEFALSAIPLGGYVEIAGNAEIGQGEQKEAFAHDEQSFARKPYYQKLLVMSGGILFNLFFAYVAIILLLAIGGLPKTTPAIDDIKPGSAAATYGLMKNDIIMQINGQTINGDWERAKSIISSLPDQEAQFTINRDGKELVLPIVVGSQEEDGKKMGILGITPKLGGQEKVSLSKAIGMGISQTNNLIWATIMGLKRIFLRGDLKGAQGPVAILSTIMQGISQSFSVFIFLLALISINLAVLNLIPLPILDGGQILYITIEAIIGRSLPLKVREYIHIASWIFMLGLILYMTANDIHKLIAPLLAKLFGR
jgi:regulator of sigma E protease